MVYRFIQKNHHEFGLRWLLSKQFTSKEFTDFCETVNITQSISKAGCPYDNAPMERYFNTLKNELIYQYHFHNDNELNNAIYDFAYVWYNHVRPHSFNNGLTPFETRCLR